LTFPMRGLSLYWFGNLFEKQMVGDFAGSFQRSIVLGLATMVVTVRLMSGGQTASVGLMMMNAMSLLQYPAAAANAVVLLLLVLLTVGVMMRLVDIRKEL